MSTTSLDHTPTAQRTERLKRIQTVSLLLLFLAGIINFLDRGSLSIANEAIRADLGLSATEFGVLLSAFSLSYGISQLPSGLLLDRFGPRVVLGAGLLFWSSMQALAGMVNNFSHFIMLRIGLGIGEAPFMPSGVKVINDWFTAKERGLPMGIFNSSTTIGQAFAPPILVALMLAFGWRMMFVIIGIAGIAIALCWYAWYRNREKFVLTQEEKDYLNAGTKPVSQTRVTLKEWGALFKRRTVWGMILGFSGVNYTGWLYLSWLPGYLQAERGLSLVNTGWVAAIPFLFGSIGMLINGTVADQLARRGYSLAKSRKSLICLGLVCSAACTLLVVQSTSTSMAVAFISLALFFVHFAGTSAWGLVQVMAPSRMVASVSSIQNFGSFIFASFAPIVTGWVVDKTHSFNLALVVCSCVTFAGALAYFFIVKDPIEETPAA
ncbi:MFS transporter [Pectobacterium zantedeschiae]|uniref:MFS transporter n=1 Tax=Pectobacterium zantedeschiae TaxID=2034769 RepID=A0A9X8JFL6_9GAMM|nr:MFS transporter [Pectobacterium zantedeschiae]RYC40135.1 MFS transporter [Pectobacterium zantedeschiae]RYC40777.1 MFS transporter [Pectobacterium zantedeschiae]